MGATPQGKNITIEFECQFRVDLQNSGFSSVIATVAGGFFSESDCRFHRLKKCDDIIFTRLMSRMRFTMPCAGPNSPSASLPIPFDTVLPASFAGEL